MVDRVGCDSPRKGRRYRPGEGVPAIHWMWSVHESATRSDPPDSGKIWLLLSRGTV